MILGGALFLIVFAFLFFVFAIFLISRFKKVSFVDFKPAISIIIPAYNEEKNIKQCLDSIKNSDYSKNKTEIIVIDDGSTDKTREIVKKYEDVKLLRQNHLGKTEALNLGTKKAKHDFVVTIDADTIVEKEFLREIIKPFSDETIGAATGNSKVQNRNTMLGSFQNVEYHLNNLIRHSFSNVFNNGIWFFGALACYRKSVLKKIGFFKKDSLAEDVDIALEIKKGGYKVFNASSACGYTVVPKNLKELYSQRARWWVGVLQSLTKNRDMFSLKACPSITFLFINHFWWTFYAFVFFPVIGYQVNYWLPYNSANFVSVFSYLFRWFSLSGPLYVIYKIPEWGLSFYSFFGVLSGIISSVMIISSIKIFKDKLDFKNLLAVFFFFPYTIILNTFIIISVLRFKTWKNFYFIK